LTANTVYAYSVVAFDAAGNVSPAATASVTTPPTGSDTSPPSPPTSLSASVLPSGLTKLSWHASTDNVAVTGYRIYRNGTLFATVTGTSVTIKKQIGTFTYSVRAFDQAGNLSGASNSVTVTVN